MLSKPIQRERNNAGERAVLGEHEEKEEKQRPARVFQQKAAKLCSARGRIPKVVFTIVQAYSVIALHLSSDCLLSLDAA